MKNEVKELLTEELGNDLGEVNQKSSKGAVLGIAAVTVGVLLFKFRHKIGAKIENKMVKALTKKGYTVYSQTELAEIGDNIDEILV